MLDVIRKGQRWLTAIFIVAIGVVFVFFIGLGGPMERSGPSGGAVVELGDIRLGQEEYLRVRARQDAHLIPGEDPGIRVCGPQAQRLAPGQLQGEVRGRHLREAMPQRLFIETRSRRLEGNFQTPEELGA